MVKINVKYEEQTEFWLDSQTSVDIAALARDINIILANKLLLLQLATAAEGLMEAAALLSVKETTNQVIVFSNKPLLLQLATAAEDLMEAAALLIKEETTNQVAAFSYRGGNNQSGGRIFLPWRNQPIRWQFFTYQGGNDQSGSLIFFPCRKRPIRWTHFRTKSGGLSGSLSSNQNNYLF